MEKVNNKSKSSFLRSNLQLSLIVLSVVVYFHRELSKGYEESLFKGETCRFQDWSQMKLKQNLIEKKDYILVPLEAWKMLQDWYGGGPEIRLIVSGTVDKNPIVLHYKTNTGKSAAFLFSLNATCKQLVNYLAELTSFCPEEMIISFNRLFMGGGQCTVYIYATSQELWEKKVEKETTFLVEKRFQKPTLQDQSEEEVLKQVLALSLKEHKEETKKHLENSHESSYTPHKTEREEEKLNQDLPKKDKQEDDTEFSHKFQKALKSIEEPKMIIKPQRLKEIVAYLNKMIDQYILQLSESN